MTATIIDDLTDTGSDKNRECKGQGVANIASGLIGGMAGCAMIGQSVINVKSGGRTRLSTLVAGVFLLILVVFLGEWVKQIPMAALVAVMIMVSASVPLAGARSEDMKNQSAVELDRYGQVLLWLWWLLIIWHMVCLLACCLSGMFFANKIAQYKYVQSDLSDDGRLRVYQVVGQVFFASSYKFTEFFDFKEVLDKVVIDLSEAHFWDISAVAALDRVVLKFRPRGNGSAAHWV